MPTSTRRRMTLGERLIALICSAGFTLVLHLYGLVMLFPIVVGLAWYRLLDGILPDTRRPLAAAIAVPFTHAVWGMIGLAVFLLSHRELPPYAAAEVGLLAGFPLLMLFFPAILPALVIVAFQALSIALTVQDLLNPPALEVHLEQLGVPVNPEELRKMQLALFAHIGYRGASIAAVLGCLFAYYWPRAPRHQRRYDDEILDLSAANADYLRPWVQDAGGRYHRG